MRAGSLIVSSSPESAYQIWFLKVMVLVYLSITNTSKLNVYMFKNVSQSVPNSWLVIVWYENGLATWCESYAMLLVHHMSWKIGRKNRKIHSVSRELKITLSRVNNWTFLLLTFYREVLDPSMYYRPL